MKLIIASDHAGFHLKEQIKHHFKNHEFIDVGTDSDQSVDYPDYAQKAAEKMNETQCNGILVCGSGIGIGIAANKVPGIRAAIARSTKDAEMARRHNNINALCLGERFTTIEEAIPIIETFVSTKFEGDTQEGARHKRRVDKFTAIEQKYSA